MASNQGRGRGQPYGDNRGGFIARGNRGGGAPGGGGRGRGAHPVVEVFSQGTGVAQPNSNVQSIEDATMKSTGELSLEALNLNASFPRRPGYGTQGKSITLYANYLELTPPQSLLLYRYSVDHLPNVRGKTIAGKKGMWVVKLLLQTHFADSLDNMVTDYSNLIISTSKLSLPQNIFEIQYQSEQDDGPRQGAQIHRLKIAPMEEYSILQLSDLMRLLCSTNMNAEFFGKSEVIQALNIMVGFQPRCNNSILSIGANKHYRIDGAVEYRNLGGGLVAVRGYYHSVRPATSRLLVNVQVKHVACYEAGSLTRLIKLYQDASGKDPSKLHKFLKGLRVEVLHITRKNAAGEKIPCIKTIFGLATRWDGQNLSNPPLVRAFGSGSDDIQFFLGGPSGDTGTGSKNTLTTAPATRGAKPTQPSGPQRAGEYITVTNYFKRIHNKYVQDTTLPVINVGDPEHPTYLPLDACTVPRGQPSSAKLSPDQAKQMISFAVRKPVQNATSITTNGVEVLSLGAQANATLRKFNISVSATLINVPGRVLLGPPVQYRNSKTANTKFGSWNMEFVQFSNPTTLPQWSYLWISMKSLRDPWENHDQLRTTMDLFQRNLKLNGLNADNLIFPGLKVQVENPDPKAQVGNPVQRTQVDLRLQNDATLEEAFDKILNLAKRPRMMIVILPTKDTAIYNQVKRLGDVKKGIHTICVLAAKFARIDPDPLNAQIFANLALKFNLKLGGINQTLNPNRLGVLAEGKTMVVGLDVTHPSPDSARIAPSIAGIVATVDKGLGQWPADLRIQTSRQEMINDLDDLFGSRLRLWQAKNNGTLPENILIYRDGVSEGQYDTILKVELPQIRQACRKTYSKEEIKKGIPYISIIVVGKRHHTRFYPTKVGDADRSCNPQNGTIVDRGVTEARNWEFYLQAHATLQGTARPAHYYVILDEIFRKRKVKAPHRNTADALEELTHNLCYLFGRATKAVSICPPAYYADLVCERARRYLSEIFDVTPAASVAESGAGGGPVVDPDAIKIHPNLENTMFYI